jgi:carbamoyl-phosphate synthase large subunit
MSLADGLAVTPRVLVTGAGGPAGGSLLRQLAERGVHAVGADVRPQPDTKATVVELPPAHDPCLVGALRQAVVEHAIDLLVPTVGAELPVVAAHRSRIGARVVVADSRSVSLAHDRALTARHLRWHGVGVPRFALPRQVAGFARAHDLLGPTLVLKPRIGDEGGGALVVRRGMRSPRWSTLKGAWVLQEFVPGARYFAAVYRAGDDRDEVVVLEESGTPGRRGVERVPADRAGDVAEVAVAAVRALGLQGPAEVQLRRTADGRPLVLDVRAHFGPHSAMAPEILDAVLADFRLRRRAVGG